MNKRIIASLTVLAFVCAPLNIIYAQLPPVDTAKIAAIGEGQRAPFQGILLSPAAYAQIRAQTTTLSDLCVLDTNTALAQQKALLDMRIAISDAQLNAEQTRRTEITAIKDNNIAYLEKQLLQNNQPTYNEVWFASGIVAGALVTIGIGFAIAEALH